MRHLRETSEYPLLAAGAGDRLKVYLDLKDWVALAKARLGRPEFPHDRAAYEAMRAAATADQLVVLLSATTYQELSRITSLRQRGDLADVIAEIGGFATITGRSVATRHQALAALAVRYGGPEPWPVRPLSIGIQFATGDQRSLVLRGRDGAPPDLPPAVVREVEIGGRALLEYMMARGPDPGDLPALRAYGYHPEAVVQVEQDRLKREEQLAAMLRDGTAARGRLGDPVHARYLFWELDSHLRVGLDQYGIDGNDFFANGKDWLTAFLDDIPAAAITMTLTEKEFRNADKTWKANDLRDADAMSAAIPYCDVVLTDKYAAAQLARSPAVTRLGTLVLPRLRDLNERLPDLIASRQPSTNNSGSRSPCAVPKLTHWLELVFTVPSGCSPVLADQGVDDVRALDPAGYIDRLAGFVQRRSLVPRLVRPVFVIVPCVLGHDILEVPFAEDQQVVQALAPQCSHVPLRKGIRPRRPEGRLDDPHAIVGEHVIEDGRELAVAVADEELELAGAFAEIHEKVAGLLGGPWAVHARGRRRGGRGGRVLRAGLCTPWRTRQPCVGIGRG